MNVEKKLIFSLILLCGILAFGTSGYMIIEGMSFLDSIYMCVITLSTVGYREVQPLDSSGMIFTIVLILAGVGTIAYLLGSLAQVMVEGQLRDIFGRHNVERKIHHLKDHYIVCGFGRMGMTVCQEIKLKGKPLIVVEKAEAAVSRMDKEGYLYIWGDATDEEVLQSAGIEKAKGLVTVLSSDVENVYVTLTAKGLNPGLFILARASEPAAEVKLKRAGASKVISPYYISGRKMAQELLKPTITNFIELVFEQEGRSIDLQMEELVVCAGSYLVDASLKDSKIRQEFNLIVVAIKKKDGTMLYNPTFDVVIEAGDTMVALGPGPNLEKLASRIGSAVCATENENL